MTPAPGTPTTATLLAEESASPVEAPAVDAPTAYLLSGNGQPDQLRTIPAALHTMNTVEFLVHDARW